MLTQSSPKTSRIHNCVIPTRLNAFTPYMLASMTSCLLLLGGCQQYYTGGLGFSGNRQQRAELESFKEEQRLKQQAADALKQSQIEEEERQAAISSDPVLGAAFEPSTIKSSLFERSRSPINQAAQPGVTIQSVGRPGNLSLFGATQSGRPFATPVDGADNFAQITFTQEGADFDPTISPNGEWVAFASTRHRETSDIYLQRVNGTVVTQLTDDPSNDMMPNFSPDGNKVAFASDRTGNWNIYIIDINGGKSVQVSRGSGDELHPSFSPDGKQLVYCSFGSRSGQWEMHIVNVDNPTAPRFIGYGLFPNWSPVDNTILFQRARQRGTKWFSAWTIDIDQNGEAVRPSEIVASANAAIITPSWSPDGERIVFSTVVAPNLQDEQPTHADVWMMDADGRNRVRLTGGDFANLQPTWARDGSIYFVSNRSQNATENIFKIRPQQAIQLTESLKNPSPTGVETRTADVPTDTPQP